MSNSSDQTRTTTVSEVLDRSKKPSSSRGSGLTGLAGQLGNDELMARLEQGNGTRDELLEFLASRLESMKNAQDAEVELAKRVDNSFRTALGESEMRGNDPKPKRWKEAAGLYESAARALCSGQLHRGKELMERAVKADKKAFNDVKSLIEFDKRLEDQGTAEDPPVLDIGPEIACTDCREPDSLRLAMEIQEVTINGNDRIKGQRRELDPWWVWEEEEEEEEAAGG